MSTTAFSGKSLSRFFLYTHIGIYLHTQDYPHIPSLLQLSFLFILTSRSILSVLTAVFFGPKLVKINRN
ncbi:hypothetical protein BGAFAR04_Ab0077 (plasmid) [Borreliella garinii Far04]|nr:hypothetical protein BGAFAR04_Ab0077 [Borreliella garinii Far04]